MRIHAPAALPLRTSVRFGNQSPPGLTVDEQKDVEAKVTAALTGASLQANVLARARNVTVVAKQKVLTAVKNLLETLDGFTKDANGTFKYKGYPVLIAPERTYQIPTTRVKPRRRPS